MSLNTHYCSSDNDHHRWSQSSPGEPSSVATLSGQTTTEEILKLTMFEKALTPSDVGKLNRLVVPKQYAEKCLPPAVPGVLLSFEDDEVGIKNTWRFRFSFWKSSQSYVFTKGWSRFVKEKGLLAGDVVVFKSHREDVGRCFIGWRRRQQEIIVSSTCGSSQPVCDGGGSQPSPGSPLPRQSMCDPLTGPVMMEKQPQVKRGISKKLRLFGVNLELWKADEHEGSSVSSQGRTHNSQYFETKWI